MKKWCFDISFFAESESEKQTKEAWLDNVFRPTSLRRVSTKENVVTKRVTIIYKDTGARKGT